MKINGEFKGEFRSLSSSEYTNNSGQKAKSWKVGVELSDTELGTLPCAAEVQQTVANLGIKKGDICTFQFEYNTDYNRLRVVSLVKYK